MFNKKDLSQIDKTYFKVAAATCYNICLQSKNTKHHWIIQSIINNGFRSLIIYHRHGNNGEFHIQPRFHPRSVAQAQELIKSHDLFQLNGRKPITV